MSVRRRKLPLGVAAALLVLALVSIGIAYGLWSKTLFIKGTVSTGDVDAVWTYAASNDSGTQIDPCSGFNPLDCDSFDHKHVGATECEIDGSDPQILHFTVTNAYPSYEADCQVEWTNAGTIPVFVDAVSILPGAALNNCTTAQQSTGTTTVTCDELTIKYVDNLCDQIDPGEEVAASIRIHVEQPALENDDPNYPAGGYAFSAELLLVQWNETTCPP